MVLAYPWMIFFFASAEDQSEEHLFEVFLFWGEPKFGKVRQNVEGMDFSWNFMAAEVPCRTVSMKCCVLKTYHETLNLLYPPRGCEGYQKDVELKS